MLKKAIPQHKRLAQGGGHTPLGYARGGMVAPMPAPVKPGMGGGALTRPPIGRGTLPPVGGGVPAAPRAALPRVGPGGGVSNMPAPAPSVVGGGAVSNMPAPMAGLKSGGAVGKASATRNPLTTARKNNGLPGMKKGGRAC